MMKAAGEGQAATAILPGQAKAKFMHKGHGAGKDQLLADFDRLLAKQSALAEFSPAKEEPQADDKAMAQPPASPDAGFLSIAGLNEIAARLASIAPARMPEAQSDASPAPMEEEPEAVQDIESKPAPRQSVSKMPVETPERLPSNPVGAPEAKAEDRTPKTVAMAHIEPTTDVEPMPHREPAAPVVTIVTVKQETYFAPAQIVMPGDRGPETAAMTPVAGPQSVAPSAPAPVIAQPAAAPLKLLKLELGTSELGPVSATMAVKNDTLDLRIKAHKDEAVASFKENAGKLTDALQSLGFSVDSVTVQKLGPADAASSFTQSQSGANGAPGQGSSNGQGQWDSSSPQAGAGGSSRQSRHTPNGAHFAEHDGNDEARNSGGARSGGDVFV